jgi:eukaryotic-like serine/threonine-protein kinase
MTERSIFLAALDIDDPQERSAYLDRACAGDLALRARVDDLLKAHQQPGDFLDRPAPALSATIDQPPLGERPGTTIGPYKLLQQIGEGGMGTVFMAEQIYPVQRKVALKIIKPGMDSRQIIARFEAERQALALMDHPNIARVLDAGTTDCPRAPVIESEGSRPAPLVPALGGEGSGVRGYGRPYFVMELVKGVPITKYCDDHHAPQALATSFPAALPTTATPSTSGAFTPAGPISSSSTARSTSSAMTPIRSCLPWQRVAAGRSGNCPEPGKVKPGQ